MEQSLMRLALQDAAVNPARIARLSLSRLAEYFRFWPAGAPVTGSDVIRFVSFGALFPFALAGIVIAGHREGTSLFLLFCGLYTAIHLLSWSLIRYRLPVDAVLTIFAAISVAAALRRFPLWRSRFRTAG
jgi:hypothetical protein